MKSNPSKRGITIPRKPGTGGEQYKGAIWRKNRSNVSLHELADQFRPKHVVVPVVVQSANIEEPPRERRTIGKRKPLRSTYEDDWDGV